MTTKIKPKRVPEDAYLQVSDLVRCYTLSGILREIMESEDVPHDELMAVRLTVAKWTARRQRRMDLISARELADVEDSGER